MSSADDLYALYKLHLVDAAIVDLRKRAASFDPTREQRAAIEAFKPEWESARAEAASLHAEQTDLELTTRSLDEKIKKIDKDLYGGKIVNPREVENLQKEIEAIKAQRSRLDSRILEIWEIAPGAKARAEEAEKKMATLRTLYEQRKQEGLRLKAELESEYKLAAAKRSGLAKAVPVGLLAQYDAIRQRQGGIGMAEILDNGSCSRCGTILPTKTVLNVRESKVETCETCHRILFVVMPEP